jgi:hypothetical protein
MTGNRGAVRFLGPPCLALAMLWSPPPLRAQSGGNSNATCCTTAQAARNLGQIRWHLLRSSLDGGVGDLIFVSPAKLASLHRRYRRYLERVPGCRDAGMAAQKRPAGRPYPYMWLMVGAAQGTGRVIRVWSGATPLGRVSGAGANVYLVPQVLHVRAESPRHCLVLASPGRWRLLRLRKR